MTQEPHSSIFFSPDFHEAERDLIRVITKANALQVFDEVEEWLSLYLTDAIGLDTLYERCDKIGINTNDITDLLNYCSLMLEEMENPEGFSLTFDQFKI
jgi:hypothetical protein